MAKNSTFFLLTRIQFDKGYFMLRVLAYGGLSMILYLQTYFSSFFLYYHYLNGLKRN